MERLHAALSYYGRGVGGAVLALFMAAAGVLAGGLMGAGGAVGGGGRAGGSNCPFSGCFAGVSFKYIYTAQ